MRHRSNNKGVGAQDDESRARLHQLLTYQSLPLSLLFVLSLCECRFTPLIHTAVALNRRSVDSNFMFCLVSIVRRQGTGQCTAGRNECSLLIGLCRGTRQM